MSNEVPNAAKAWREEVDHLFGIPWDRFIEWVLIGWLSAWVWTAWMVSNAFIFPRSGPISWIADVVRSLGGEPAAWLLAIPVWLTDSHRSVLLPISIVVSSIVVTLSLRSYKLTGLRVLALATATVAVEIDGSMLPLVWICAIAAGPAVVALLLGLRPADRERDEDGFFYAEGAVRWYIMRVMGLYAMPIAAPFLLGFVLVFSYRVERLYRPSEELARSAARHLASESRQGKSLATADPLTVVSALVAAVTAATVSPSGQAVAASLNYQFDERQAERDSAGRRKRGLEW